MEVKDQVKKAIADITYETKKFPEEAFQIISENPADAAADLMNALTYAIEERDEIEEGYMLHFYAAYLLAQFEYKPAFPLLLEMSSLPGEVLDILIGDTVTEGLRDILYSTYNGDWEAVRDYLIYEDCYDYAKCAALDLAVQLYLDGALEKQELTGLFEKLIYHPEVCDDVYFDTRIAGSICQCHFIEMLPDIRYLYEEDRLDESVFGYYDSFVDYMFEYRDKAVCQKIGDAANRLRKWAMFKQDPEQHFDKKAYEKLLKGMSKDLAASRQIVKNEKIYPNDPCPCGSGKKYKKCCMNKPQMQSNIEQVREDREKWLKFYPPKAEPRVKNRIYLEDFYDNESIEIDKLIYLALMHRPGLPSERGTEAEQRARQRYYLWEAFKIFQEKCNREGIQTFAEYDAKYMIHYDSKRWMKYLEYLLSGNKTEAEQRRVIDLQTALRTAEI